MESYFPIMFEDIGHERSLILLLSLTDPAILKQGKFADLEIFIVKNSDLEKLHRQRMSKEYTTLPLLEEYFIPIRYCLSNFWITIQF